MGLARRLRKVELTEKYAGDMSTHATIVHVDMDAFYASVEQLDRSGNTVRKYTLLNCFPKDVAAIDVGYDSVDTISEFGVTFGYTHFTLS